MTKYLNLKGNIAIGLLFAFLVNTIGPWPQARATASVGQYDQADEFRLPAPGVRVSLSPAFNPPILKGIKVHPDDPFRFEFILDQADPNNGSSHLKQESTRLIKYFLASLTTPEKDLWVNLSPYEKKRIIPQSFGLTEMGRDLLAEDYMLKQITASLIYPEDVTGKKFWQRIYEEAEKKFGTTNIPVSTFNKVWIVPASAVVYENTKAGTAYIVGSKLKVMLEQDYLAFQKNSRQPDMLSSQVIREIVIPELNKEVNENKNFTQLRQVYNSLILATWYKKKIKDSILEQVYRGKNKVAGVGFNNSLNAEAIYQRYLQAFKKGAFNYIKEDFDQWTQQSKVRKYFSGGFDAAALTGMLQETNTMDFDSHRDHAMVVNVRLSMLTIDPAMLAGLKTAVDQFSFDEGYKDFQDLRNAYNALVQKELRVDLKLIARERRQRASIQGGFSERKVLINLAGEPRDILIRDNLFDILEGQGKHPVISDVKGDKKRLIDKLKQEFSNLETAFALKESDDRQKALVHELAALREVILAIRMEINTNQAMSVAEARTRIQDSLKGDGEALERFVNISEKSPDRIFLLIAHFIGTPGIEGIIERLNNADINAASGLIGELDHASLLQQEGYEILAFGLKKSYGLKGETDILVRKNGQLIFVEVKHLTGDRLLVDRQSQTLQIYSDFLATSGGRSKFDQYKELISLAADPKKHWVLHLDFDAQLGGALTKELIKQLSVKGKLLKMIYSIALTFPGYKLLPDELQRIQNVVAGEIRYAGRKAGLDVEVIFRQGDSAQTSDVNEIVLTAPQTGGIAFRRYDQRIFGPTSSLILNVKPFYFFLRNNGLKFDPKVKYELAQVLRELEFNARDRSKGGVVSREINLYRSQTGKQASYVLRASYRQLGIKEPRYWEMLKRKARMLKEKGIGYFLTDWGEENRGRNQTYVNNGFGMFHLGLLMRMTTVYLQYVKEKGNIIDTDVWIELDPLRLKEPAVTTDRAMFAELMFLLLSRIIYLVAKDYLMRKNVNYPGSGKGKKKIKVDQPVGEVLRQVQESQSLKFTADTIAHYRDNDSVLRSIILHSNDQWAALLAMDRLWAKPKKNKKILDEFNGLPINGDLDFMKKYKKLNDDLDKIFIDLKFPFTELKKQGLNRILGGSADKRLDYLAEKFVLILNYSINPNYRYILPRLENEILPQFQGLRHPLTLSLPTLDDWLSYSIEGYHKDYVKRTKYLSELTDRPWASALVFAANGPHTRFLYTSTDKEDIEADTYLINGFIGAFWEKMGELMRLTAEGRIQEAGKLEKEIQGFAGALLNGLLVQSDLPIDKYLRKLSKGILAGKPKMEGVVEHALRMFPVEMPSFLHYADGNFGNEAADDLAYYDLKNNKQVTIRDILTGSSSVDADEYRQSVERWNRTHFSKVEPESEIKRMYAWLRQHFINEEMVAQTASAAMSVESSKTGGIDLSNANRDLQTQDAGEGIEFHLDPAMLAQLQNAPGVVPVIINIQPLIDLRSFLC